jgi:hypothetical protein
MLTKKKLASLAMAGVMTMSLAAPAFAATTKENTTNRSLKVTAAYQAVTINVVVPTTGTVVIDPYKLPVSVGTKEDGSDITIKDQQIVTKPLAVKNQSDIDLDVNIATTTALTGNLKLATKSDEIVTTGDNITTTNTAFVYVNVLASDLTGNTDKVTEAAIVEDYAGKTVTEYADDNAGKTQLVLKSGSQTMTAAATLTKSTLDSGTFSEYAAGSIAYIQFGGICVQNPKTAWTTKDGLTCTMAFTFTPHVETTD